LQSTGGGRLQEGSLGLALQSTVGSGVVLHDASSGFVLQSTGDVDSVGLHDASSGFVLQYCGHDGSSTLEHSGEFDPSSHVDGGVVVSTGGTIGSVP
jgi:hypothetical protein